MNKIEFLNNLNESQQRDALDIFYNAFKLKIEKLELQPYSEKQGKRILFKAAHPHLIIAILNNDNKVMGY